MSLFCMHCGREIPNDAEFCPYCGSVVNREVRQQTEEPFVQMPEEQAVFEEEYAADETYSGRSNRGEGFLTKLRSGKIPTVVFVILAVVVIAAIVAIVKVVQYFDRPILYVDHSGNWEYIASGRREKSGTYRSCQVILTTSAYRGGERKGMLWSDVRGAEAN